MIASDDEDEGWCPATCDEYVIIKTLGEGKTSKVKLAKDSDGKLVALKRFK
jgi:serine/threonine protein kinase